jgi:hypothetical protein
MGLVRWGRKPKFSKSYYSNLQYIYFILLSTDYGSVPFAVHFQTLAPSLRLIVLPLLALLGGGSGGGIDVFIRPKAVVDPPKEARGRELCEGKSSFMREYLDI